MNSVTPALSAAQRRAILDEIVIDNPRARTAHRVFNYLIELSSLRPNEPKRCVSMIAHSQSGKTTIIDSHVAMMNTAAALKRGEIPALKVTLRANITRRQFAQDILEAIERFGFNALVETGSEAQLLRRAANYLVARKVRMLYLDEFHHLVHSDNRKVVMSVSETVKHLLLTGPCPIVVAGLPEARKPFDQNAQLAHRAEPHLDLHRLDPHSSTDVDLFWTFLTDYLVTAEREGAGQVCGLIDGKCPSCLMEVSQGILGAACNLIKDAVHVAAIAGRMEVTHEDAAMATDMAIRNGLYHRNPFREGLAPTKRRARL